MAVANYAVVPEVRQWLALDNQSSPSDKATTEEGDHPPETTTPAVSQQQEPPAGTADDSAFRTASSHPIGKSAPPRSAEDSAPRPPTLVPAVKTAAPVGAEASTGNVRPALHYILESDFDDQVLKNSGPVLVFFCTDYQDPCRIMQPTISEVAQERQPKLKTIAIDVNINKEIAAKYGAGYFDVPVTVLFSGGIEKGSIKGAASKTAVEHLIDNPQAFSKQPAMQDPIETIHNVPESDFSEQVLRANVPVLVYFYSSNDACRQVSPLVSQITGENKETLRVLRVDSNAESDLAAEYQAGYWSNPLLILFKDGEPRGMVKGTTSLATIEDLIQHPENYPFSDAELPNVSATLVAVPDLHEAEFQDTLKSSKTPTLVYFYNDDKDPNSRAVAHIISVAIKPYKGKIKLFKMDTSNDRDIANKYDSWDGPALVLFIRAKAKDRKSGMISREDITSMMIKALSVKGQPE
ncbi:MAG: thioredoxin domain-containing protein [Acidobacteriaceae bacterium]